MNEEKDTVQSLFVSEFRSQRQIFEDAITTSSIATNNSNHQLLHETKFPKSFFSVSQQIFRQLAEQCKNSSEPAIIFVAWEKIKESGMLLNASTLNALLNVASKMMSGNGKDHVFEHVESNNHQCVLALEEIVMYHDVLCGPTDKEESLVAEAAVRTFKVSACLHIKTKPS